MVDTADEIMSAVSEMHAQHPWLSALTFGPKGWSIPVGLLPLAVLALVVAVVLMIVCWAKGESMYPFVGTPDTWNRQTGAGRGLWFSVVRPWDTRPRHTAMDGQNS